MKTTVNLIERNLKMFFKDKGAFFSSLITPIILLVLYATFLATTYKKAFAGSFPEGIVISDKVMTSLVVSQLVSSLLAVSCVTVSFCANLLMIGDKSSKRIDDFSVSPVNRSALAFSYYAASSISTLIITFTATLVSYIYLLAKGCSVSAGDIVKVLFDVVLLTLFGTALSSCINFFLSSDGQASAVGTIISAGYGFVCGAYMPISNFSSGLQKLLMFLPGTYGTALVRNHVMGRALEDLKDEGLPSQAIDGLRDSIDCNLYFFDKSVSIGTMYAVIGGTVLILTLIFVLLHIFDKKRSK